MALKFKIHTESKDRRPWDIEVEAEFNEETIKAFGDMLKKPDFEKLFDNIGTHLMPALVNYALSKSNPPSIPQPPSMGPIMGAMLGPPMPPIDPAIMTKLIESLGRPKPATTDQQPDIFKHDKAEPKGGYVPKKTPVDNKPKSTSTPINKTIKKIASKEIKIEDGAKDLLKQSYESIKGTDKEKLFEAARKRIADAAKPKIDPTMQGLMDIGKEDKDKVEDADNK
jgi:hypothetical protein